MSYFVLRSLCFVFADSVSMDSMGKDVTICG